MIRVPRHVLLAGVALALLGYGALSTAERVAERGLFWDVEFYRVAIDHFREGESPYTSDGVPTGYFYSLSLLPLLAVWPEPLWIGTSYGWLVGTSILVSLALVLAALPRSRAPLVLVGVYALAFGNGQPAYLFASGNLGWLASLLVAAALFAASRRRWTAFYVLVGLAALLKPYSLSLLLVPLVMGSLSLWALLALLPLTLDALATHWVSPALLESRAEAIWMAVGEPLMLRYSLAGGVSRVLAWTGLGAEAATAAGAAVHLALVAPIVVILRKRVTSDRRGLAWSAVAVCCALPRLANYDAFVFGPALLAALWPSSEEGSRPRASAVAILTLALFKEGLVLLPISVLVYLLATPTAAAAAGRQTGTADHVPEAGGRLTPSTLTP